MKGGQKGDRRMGGVGLDVLVESGLEKAESALGCWGVGCFGGRVFIVSADLLRLMFFSLPVDLCSNSAMDVLDWAFARLCLVTRGALDEPLYASGLPASVAMYAISSASVILLSCTIS